MKYLKYLTGIVLVALLLAAVPSAWAVEEPPVFELKWGSPGSGDGEFNNPRGVAVDEIYSLLATTDTGLSPQDFQNIMNTMESAKSLCDSGDETGARGLDSRNKGHARALGFRTRCLMQFIAERHRAGSTLGISRGNILGTGKKSDYNKNGWIS